jgi:hypothetical protein
MDSLEKLLRKYSEARLKVKMEREQIRLQAATKMS